jgi:hypothetical protein
VPPREGAGSGISHSVYDIRKRKKVWTVVWKESDLTMNERTDVSKNAGDNVIVANLIRQGEKMLRIVNIYDQRARGDKRETS